MMEILGIIGLILIIGGFPIAIIKDQPAYLLISLLGIPFSLSAIIIEDRNRTMPNSTVEACMADASKLEKSGEPCMKNLLTKLLADGKMTRYEFYEYEEGVHAWNNRVFANKIDQFKFGVSK